MESLGHLLTFHCHEASRGAVVSLLQSLPVMRRVGSGCGQCVAIMCGSRSEGNALLLSMIHLYILVRKYKRRQAVELRTDLSGYRTKPHLYLLEAVCIPSQDIWYLRM